MLGGRVCAEEAAARARTPKTRKRIVVEQPNFGMEDPPYVDEPNFVSDDGRRLADTGIEYSCLHSTWSGEHCSTFDRVIRRKAIIAAALATDPYSSSRIQSGTSHGRPSVRRYQ